MENEQKVDPEDDHFYITGAAIEKAETMTKNGIIYLANKPVAFRSDDSE